MDWVGGWLLWIGVCPRKTDGIPTLLKSFFAPRNLIFFLSQTYEEALEAQKAKKEAKKPSKAKNSDANKKKKWKKNNKGDIADKNDAVSVVTQQCLKKTNRRLSYL